jgi:hypothetical protein
MRLARFTVSGEWLRVRSRKYMGAPGGVNVDRGADSSPSSAANQSVGGGGDDIPDKLATPIRQPGRPPLRLRNRAETHSRCAGQGPACSPCAGVAGGHHRCRCSLRGCPSVASGSPDGGGRGAWCRGARCRRRPPLLPALPGGRGKFLRRASPSWAGAPGGCPGCGLAVVVYRAAVSHAPAQFSSTPEQEPAPATPATSSRSPPREETNPGTPYRPVAAVAAPRRESRVVPAAVPPGGRVCPGRTRAPPPPLPPASVLECAGRCGLHRGYLALPRRCALRPLPDLRSNCPLRRRRLARPFRRSAQCGRFRCKTHLPSADHTSTGRN